MGHASGGHYGMGNHHGPIEQLYDDNFDNLLSDFKQALPQQHDEIFITLEVVIQTVNLMLQQINRKKRF